MCHSGGTSGYRFKPEYGYSTAFVARYVEVGLMTLRHEDLCELAVKWLQRAPGRQGAACQVAFSEAKCKWDGEIPDAIGFRTTLDDEASVVVEAKVSRADFLADRAKPHRADSRLGMGVYRYFIAPADLIGVAELPPLWGLIEVSDRGVMQPVAGHVLYPRREQHAWRHVRSIEREWLLLASMLSRVGDVDRMHAELKRVNNERQRLARQVDALAARERERNVAQFATEHAQSGQVPMARAKAKDVSST
jgi:hypothetical protein